MNWIKASKLVFSKYGIEVSDERQLDDGDYLKHFELTSSMFMKMKDDILVEFVDEDILTEYLAEEPTAEFIAKVKILKASKECKARIVDGFESKCLGVTKHFDATMEDQATIQGLTLTAIMGLQGLTQEETHWKAAGELECYKFEYVQMLKLAEDLKRHIEVNINLFNAERLAILSD